MSSLLLQVIFTGHACLDVIEEQQQQRGFGTVASEVGMGPMPWSSHEEQLLLEAVEQCGFGNWEEVAAHVGNQTAAEACNHYLDLYVYGNLGHACIPEHIPNRFVNASLNKHCMVVVHAGVYINAQVTVLLFAWHIYTQRSSTVLFQLLNEYLNHVVQDD